jgi:dTDP-4-amino-4,6-dideoxygalactose transaminase
MMDTSKIWLSSPHMGVLEQEYVQEAFNGNWIAPLGPNVTGFEASLEKYLGNDVHVAALSSGTAALHLALILLGVERDDEVLCQTFTFSASANPIVYLGAKPIFVDSEPESWNICPDALEEAIKDRLANGIRPKAIIAVHLYGMPYKADEIQQISIKYNIPVIEDSAEALGSSYKGRPCGTLGSIGVFSFNGNKIITTSAGGALVTNNSKVRDRAVFLSTQARDDAPHYEHSTIGYNYRMSNICAGIGRGQMEVLENRVALRREMHNFYADFFKNISGVSVFEEYDEAINSNFWLTSIEVDPKESGGKTNEGLRLALQKENIESRPLWKPMHLQPVFKDCLYYGSNVAEGLFNTGLCLPSGSNLNDADRERIYNSMHTFFK